MIEPFKRVLVGTDFSEHAERAVERAVDVATHYGAKLHLVHAWDYPAVAYPALGDMIDVLPHEQSARDQFDALVASLALRGVVVDASLRRGAACDQIVSLVGQIKADLVVVGTHGRTGIKRVALGSVAERVVRHAPVPVLTVR